MMNIKKLIIVISLHYINNISLPIIRKPLSQIAKRKHPLFTNFNANVCIGSPKQCFDMLVDPIYPYIWVTDSLSDSIKDRKKKYALAYSQTKYFDIDERDIDYRDGLSIFGYIVTDDFAFTSTELNVHLMFLDAKKVTNGDDITGVIGLNHTDSFASLIDNLIKKKNIISHNIITIKLNRYINTNFGEITLGEIPSYMIGVASDYFGTCKGTGYRCDINSVKILRTNGEDEGPYDIDEEVIFDLNTNRIIVPSYFMYYIEIEVIKRLLDKNKCIDYQVNSEGEKEYISFICDSIDGEDSGGFVFVFDHYGMKIRFGDMFKKTDRGYELIFISTKGQEEWIFGLPIFELFEMTFDKDKELIGFYSKMNTVKVHEGPRAPIYLEGSKKDKESKSSFLFSFGTFSYCIMFLVFIIFIFVLFLFIRKKRRDYLREKPIEVEFNMKARMIQ